MSIETERVDHFTVWRDARKAEAYDICENCVRDLLSTLVKHQPLRKSLSDKFNEEFAKCLKDLKELKESYNTNKRLTIGFQASALQSERQRQFWNEMYDVFYNEFVNHSMFPSYLAEGS